MRRAVIVTGAVLCVLVLLGAVWLRQGVEERERVAMSGKVVKMTPTLSAVDSEDTDQKVVGRENEVKQGASKGADAAKIATTAGVGAAIGGLADRSWKGAGIGAGIGGGVGLATVLLTRGREVELHQGSTIDVVFDRDMNPSTFTTADLVRLIGPVGNIPLFDAQGNPLPGVYVKPDPNPQYPRLINGAASI